MPNKVKYNPDGTENALFRGNWAIDTSAPNTGGGPSSITGFYNGADAPEGGYVIYEEGVVRTLNSEQELIDYAAGKSEGITTLADAINWTSTQTGSVLVNTNDISGNWDLENIVTEGLVLRLDAGNPNSYSGAGTTWSDLSGYGNDATLVNGPSFNGSNEGVIQFDGTNDHVTIQHNTTYPATTNIRGSITVGMFCKSNHTLSTGWNIYWSGVSKYNQFILGPNGVGGKMAFLIHSGTWYPLGYGGSIWGQTSIDARDYHYYVGTYDQSTGMLSLYVDGALEVSFDIGVRTLSDDPNSFVINKRDTSGNYLKSTTSMVHIYNRALSAAEILQNYNATKSRFGL